MNLGRDNIAQVKFSSDLPMTNMYKNVRQYHSLQYLGAFRIPRARYIYQNPTCVSLPSAEIPGMRCNEFSPLHSPNLSRQ